MSSAKQQGGVRRSDPSLREKPSKDSFRPFGLPRWAGWLLYAVFWVLLLVPLVRRWRRREGWKWIRLGIALAGSALLAAGFAGSEAWLAIAGGGLLLASLLLAPAPDPDQERKLQSRHGADYLLNGGRWISGELPTGKPPPKETALYLLLKGRELLAVPQKGDGQVLAALKLDDIQEILVAGETYFPVYVSEAKDPPVREERVDQSAVTLMELVLKPGGVLRFEYAGAFSKHLAATAAHAIYSARKLGASDGVRGQTPEVFHIVGR